MAVASYALIQSNQIIGICLWDGVSPFSPGSGTTTQLLSSLPAGVQVGSTFNGSIWVAPTTTPQTTGLTFQQFVSLFTVAEFNAIVSASITNPAVMIGFLKFVSYSGNINLSNQQVTTAVNGLVALSLLTSLRATAVLAGTVVNPAA